MQISHLSLVLVVSVVYVEVSSTLSECNLYSNLIYYTFRAMNLPQHDLKSLEASFTLLFYKSRITPSHAIYFTTFSYSAAKYSNLNPRFKLSILS